MEILQNRPGVTADELAASLGVTERAARRYVGILREAGIPVEYVKPAYTSQTCHACGHIGRRDEQAEFRCTNDECHISTFQADINAAANIARRVDPWGESVPWKPERDDTPRNGSPSDRATSHRETRPKSGQMTLAAFEG